MQQHLAMATEVHGRETRQLALTYFLGKGHSAKVVSYKYDSH